MSTSHPQPRDHDHQRCVGDALERAERVCADRVVRLTPIRRQVLEIVWSSHDPIGAYDIMAKLPRAPGERPAAPMTVYRALDFLVEQGLVHRLDSLNAFVGCDRATERHAGQILVCQRCGRVAEIDAEIATQERIAAQTLIEVRAAQANGEYATSRNKQERYPLESVVIVRRTPGGQQRLAADDATPLLVGDTVILSVLNP